MSPSPSPPQLQCLKCVGPRQTLNIEHVVNTWKVGVNIKTMESFCERDKISNFCRENYNGTKYVKQYVLEGIVVPGSDTPPTVVRR